MNGNCHTTNSERTMIQRFFRGCFTFIGSLAFVLGAMWGLFGLLLWAKDYWYDGMGVLFWLPMLVLWTISEICDPRHY